MSRLPTDLQIFEQLYALYAEPFLAFTREEPTRRSRIYIPIDIPRVAEALGTNAHELFGRLYYHLDHKYRYKQDDGANVHLFAFAVGDDRHCINYPYLAAILAEHRLEDRRNQWSLWLSIISLVIAGIALFAQLLASRA